ncbi:DnaB-like helicase C-terminal domain-containing protein [Nostocoides sp. Soil756]|uniref:DnaB-like helicase C-terminal domain-containing protein n=1 Tax=Nostocoides sp. Soil756 TaxID=1736399 RepID=UPI0006F6EB19|nr:DnaB-like helicase C-terminal domain-containing protein [Tetrasphaera sp. Soil756]KRE61635.1 helicase DnaB [Tetrasphaera sp. Soil756]
MTETRSSTHRPDRRRSVRTLLDQTDDALRRGARPGAVVWPSGFRLLDSTLDGGLRSGELVLLGGSEGSGKTTLAVQMVRNAVAAGRSAVIFSFEHEAGTVVQRLLGLEAAYAAEASDQPVSQAGNVHAFRAVFEAEDPHRQGLAEALGHLPYGRAALTMMDAYAERLHIHEANSQTTIEEIASVVAMMSDEIGERPMVLVDYLQKVPRPGVQEDETTRVTIVTESLKDLAMEMECPVVAISAADRDSLGSGRRMRTHDLRGSSALAYEADVVLILSSKDNIVSREHLVYDLGAIKIYRRWSVITVEKNRHGSGSVELELQKDFEHGRFHPTMRIVSERLIEERVFTT